jgi:hypothetical protein
LTRYEILCRTKRSYRGGVGAKIKIERPTPPYTHTHEKRQKMSAPNKATEMIAEIATAWWSDTDVQIATAWWADTGVQPEGVDADDVEDCLYGVAHDILACEPEYDNGEPFPEWTTLVMTPAINETIDYNWVAERVRAHLATLGAMGEE